MSPRVKNKVLTAGALAGAVLVVAGAFRPIIRPAAKAAIVETLDSTYVMQQSFDRKAITDSLNHLRELEKIAGRLDRADSSLTRIELSLQRMERRR